MKTAAFLLCIWGLTSSVNARADQCAHRIIFLPQTHPLDGESYESYAPAIEETAQSQYKIAQYIDNHRGIPVFSEQAAAVDYEWRQISKEERELILAKVRRLFPNGFPARYESLSPEQKLFIYDNGGDFLAMYRQDIDSIHRVIKDTETADKVFAVTDRWLLDHPGHLQVYSPEVAHLVFDVRESLALDEINNYFAAHPRERDVILMFGSGHDFQRHPRLLDPACFIVPADFKSDLSKGLQSAPPVTTPSEPTSRATTR